MTEKYSRLKDWLTTAKVIGFDLDDTLWDNSKVITEAINAQYQYLVQQLRAQSHEVSAIELEAAYRSITDQLKLDNFPLYQDVTRLRLDALGLLCDQYGLASQHAKRAFEAFFHQRQQVRLYPEVKPLLELLGKKYRLIVISNGNSSLDVIGLADYFDLHWQAGRDGDAKPSGDMLVKALQHYGITPEQFIYIGDNYHTDGKAVLDAGVRGVIIPSDRKENLDQASSASAISIIDNLGDLYRAIGQ